MYSARTKTRDRTLIDQVRLGVVDQMQARSRRRWLVVGGFIFVAALLIWLARRVSRDEPVVYSEASEHFKYGSIGSEPGGSLFHPVGGVLPPAKIFAVLPDMFPERLPGGYASLGLIYEPEEQRPIGVSQRERLGLTMAGLNCAVCHTGTIRTSPEAASKTVLGMPAHQLDIQRLFAFILESMVDPQFTPENVTSAVEKRFGPLNLVDRVTLGQLAVPRLRESTEQLRSQVGRLFDEAAPKWGPGRVDTFNPYKAIQFNWQLDRLPASELAAASDFPAVWNQRIRIGMNAHWDGNNSSLVERNLSAGLGAGITPVTADHEAIGRIASFLYDLAPPTWPEELPLNRDQVADGRQVYRRVCAQCHDLNGSQIGAIEPVDRLRTDRHRLDSYTLAFADAQNTLFADTPHRFTHFRKTNGYSNQPLDGIWARAPYLHNGSVPTLADLLTRPGKRPPKFYRGCDLYDPVKIGFVSTKREERGRAYFEYDTSLPGNSNQGHEYGVDLSEQDKLALLEYLKTL